MITAAIKSRRKKLARTSRESKELDFHIDTLESRKMLAGDVAVSVNNAGDVTIIGDAAANEITLDADDGLGGTDLVITGANGTMVSFNGTTLGSQTISLDTASTVAGRLRIFTKGGDDIVTVRDTDVTENLFITTRAGDDTMTLDNVTANGRTKLRSKWGNDDLQILNSNINGEARILLGAAADTMSLDANAAFAMNVIVDGRSGADEFTGFSSNFTMAPTWLSMETRATVADVIADQSATEGSPFAFTIPVGGFADAGDTPTLTATLPDDSPLPAWLSFDGAALSGTPAFVDVGTLSVKVTATDVATGTVSVSDTFDIVVNPII